MLPPTARPPMPTPNITPREEEQREPTLHPKPPPVGQAGSSPQPERGPDPRGSQKPDPGLPELIQKGGDGTESGAVFLFRFRLCNLVE